MTTYGTFCDDRHMTKKLWWTIQEKEPPKDRPFLAIIDDFDNKGCEYSVVAWDMDCYCTGWNRVPCNVEKWTEIPK